MNYTGVMHLAGLYSEKRNHTEKPKQQGRDIEAELDAMLEMMRESILAGLEINLEALRRSDLSDFRIGVPTKKKRQV